jgi:ABC-type transport system substrate-binding protein
MRNAEFDAAFIAAQSEIDPQRRRQLLQRASAILQDEAAYLPVVTTVLIYGTDGRTTTNQGSDAYPRLDLVYKRR